MSGKGRYSLSCVPGATGNSVTYNIKVVLLVFWGKAVRGCASGSASPMV